MSIYSDAVFHVIPVRILEYFADQHGNPSAQAANHHVVWKGLQPQYDSKLVETILLFNDHQDSSVALQNYGTRPKQL